MATASPSRRSSFRAVLLLLTSLAATNAHALVSRTLVTFDGEAAADLLGASVASVGDVNGDGIDDVAVGAPGYDFAGADAGRVYVHFGRAAVDAVPDWTLIGAPGDQLGGAVAAAGDVNRDGYADVIVGARFNDAGGADAGRAYVYFGGPSGMTLGMTLTGAAAGDLFGGSVASAGDVNRDGYADVIVGAAGNDAGGANAGRAYVYFGGSPANAVVDLTLTGVAANDQFGFSVAGGDVNGDGAADLIVGAPTHDTGGADAGRVYVYHGGIAIDAVADLTLTGAAAVDFFGYAVDAAVDVNADGFGDVIVGAPNNDAGGANAGRAYVFWGGAVGDATADLTLTGALTGEQFGWSVAGARDLNGDHLADVLVGALASDLVAADVGAAYVYCGGPAADAIADLTLVGEAAGDQLGVSVDGGGDVDGDGRPDLIVGAYSHAGFAGRAYVFTATPYEVLTPRDGVQWVAGQPAPVRWRGSDLADLAISFDAGATWSTLHVGVGGEEENQFILTAPAYETSFARVRLSRTGQAVGPATSSLSPGVFRIVLPTSAPVPAHRERFAIPGAAANDFFGRGVAIAGDVNGDGWGDVIVGAPHNDAGGASAGQAYVYYGGPAADAVPDLTLPGLVGSALFGWSVAGAGDVNGDGWDDVIVGAMAEGAGRAYVFFGGATPDAVADLSLTGESLSDGFGYSVAGAGDVNGDGWADVIVGARTNDAAGLNAGRAYIYFGGPSADAIADVTLTGGAAGDAFGWSVAGAGDVNEDGFADVIAGSPDALAQAGRAHVFFGGSAVDAVADVTLTASSSFPLYGSAVSGAGDVNGDGFDDFLVGANGGGAHVYFGGPLVDALADGTFPSATLENAGFAVSGAGDVNEDGYADVMVGAPGSDVGGPAAGRTYVFLGGPFPDPVPDVVLTGKASDGAGIAVAGGGDVTGDGKADLVVGGSGIGGSPGFAYVYEFGRYFLLSPDGGEQWVAGLPATVRWLGPEPADVAVSLDGGFTWETLASGAGGASDNTLAVTAPLTTTAAAKVRVSQTGAPVTASSSDASDAVFSIVRASAPPAAAHRLAAWKPTGAASSDRLGSSVAGAGDVNGDGHDDVIAGAPLNDAGGANAGRAYVYFGGPAADAIADLTLSGAAADDRFGWAVAGAGDVNRDGYADVVVGAIQNDAGAADAGRAYVYFGGPSPDAVADLILTGEASGDLFGYSVAGAGDVNRDGYADVVVGAVFHDAAGLNAGRAYVFFGGPAPNSAADMVLTPTVVAGHFGVSVAAAGDANGDGWDDVIVGSADDVATNGTTPGRAWIYFGGPAPDATADLGFTGVATENFGFSVDGAGDVNGDGHADVIVGAPSSDAVAANAGRACVFFCGPTADAIADLTLTGVSAGEILGQSVALVGDVNADGFADAIAGAPGNDAGGTNAGRTYLYFGGASPDAIADVVLTGPAPQENLGNSVAAAGDVNGDGNADVIVGAHLANVGGSEAGRVYVDELNRYFVTSPNDDEVWNVGAAGSVTWLGAEPADLWLSTNGGTSWELLKSDVGGEASNTVALVVPHAPTKFARVKVTAHDTGVSGADESDSLFTIQSSVALLNLVATLDEGGAQLRWSSEPGVGPSGLAGYRLYRIADGGIGSGTRIGPELITETRYTDAGGTAGTTYRLTAVNGLMQELELGRVSLASQAPLAAWPTPYREGTMRISFATYGGLGGGNGDASVELYDVSGRLVRTLARGTFPAGRHVATWDGRDAEGRRVGAGVYFVRSRSAADDRMLKVVVAP